MFEWLFGKKDTIEKGGVDIELPSYKTNSWPRNKYLIDQAIKLEKKRKKEAKKKIAELMKKAEAIEREGGTAVFERNMIEKIKRDNRL